MNPKYFHWCMLLLQSTNIVRALPAQLNITSDHHTSSINLSGENQVLSLLPSINLTSPIIDWDIPSTSLTLRLRLSSTHLVSGSMQNTLLRTQVKIRRYLATHYQADRDVLFPSDDPYKSDPMDSNGCFFAITHWPINEEKRLTYGMVDWVLKGLYEYLIRGEKFVETDFYALNEGKMTGYGMIRRDRPRYGTNIVAVA